jgi:tetratricopeptide (TPR) repeat protein
MTDFFISYNKADRTWAEWTAWQLEEEGYTTILQAWDFRPSGNFVLDMQRATREAERTIAVLSPDFLASSFTQPEWAAAFAQDPTGEKGILLPVRVRECDIKGLLGQIVYIDLIKLDEAAAKRALFDGVKRGRAKPKQQPDYPGAPARTIVSKPRFPGALPAIWNIPHLRNPNFTGREANLQALRDSLLAGETAALVQARAIHGLGGVGKTQLAVEYAYRNGANYDVVWWVRSEDQTTLASDYAGLAIKLGLPEKDVTKQRVIVEAVSEWLRQNRGWLVIFDNAVDAKSVRDYLPRGGAGHIIVTSRNPSWTGVAKPFSVQTLPLPEAIEFLFKRTGHQDEATAKILAEALGCLPLALEQAGAYIETSGCTMAHYLDLFEKRQYELLQRGKPSTEYPDTVATTWSLSFQNVEGENPAAAELLRLCAFFAPDDIPIKMLTDGAKELPQSLAATIVDPLLLDEALMALRKYSLIEVDNETMTIHRLVQAVFRHMIDDSAFKQWTGVAVHVVNASIPDESDDVRTWPICAPLLPHASAALSHAEVIRFVSNQTAQLLNQIGIYLFARGENTQAKRMLEKSLAIDEATFGPNHPNVAIRLNNLGNVLLTQGDFAGAKALLERALTIDEAVYGSDHTDVATDLSNLGFVLQAQGDLTGAKALSERALTIDEAALGPDHLNVAIRLNNLGFVLQAQGDLTGAKVLYERALIIEETVLGRNHPYVAAQLNNLGNVLREQGDLAGAKALLERALLIGEAALGLNHPRVASFTGNLGSVLREQGDMTGAKALYERSLHILREYLGDHHPSTKKVQNNLRELEEKLRNKNASSG